MNSVSIMIPRSRFAYGNSVINIAVYFGLHPLDGLAMHAIYLINSYS